MMDEERFIELLESALDKRSRIDAKEHFEHHEFISSFIKRERIRTERWEEIQRQVLGWGAIALIGGIGTIIAKKIGIQL